MDMSNSQTAVGRSRSLSYEEALKDAISKLQQPQNADFLNVEVVSTNVFVNGFVEGMELQITVIATTAAKEALPLEEIEIEGCLKIGTDGRSLILTTTAGKLYSLHGANLPGLDKKLVVRVKGKPGGASHCMGEIPLEVTFWDWTRQPCHG